MIKQLNNKLEKFLENNIKREWEYNGHKFSETVVETKQVEVIQGLVLPYNKIIHEKDGVETRQTWELDKSINLNNANQFLMGKIAHELGETEFRVDASSGAIPITIRIKGDI